MSPADDTPAADSTVSQHTTLSPARGKLTTALLDCLDRDASYQSFLDCLAEHHAEVRDWIAEDLRAHFHERWQPHNTKNLRPLDWYTELLKPHIDAVKSVYCECRRAAEADCPELKKFTNFTPIGQGSFGEVFKALHVLLAKWVAIKFTHWHDGLKTEADVTEPRIAVQFDPPGFVKVLDVFLTRARRLAIVMEWVEAPTLKTALADNPGPFPLRRACTILVWLLKALEKIHAAGIVHNDVKPANLFLNADDTIRLSDFGGATKIGARRGQFTARYAAPELLRIDRQPFSVKTDLYSVACIAYELLTGTKCHAGEGHHDGSYLDPQQVNPNLPRALAEAVNWGLERDSNHRPRSAGEYAGRFQAFLDALPPEAPPDAHRLGPEPPACFGRDDFVNMEVAAIRDGLGSPRRARLYHGPGGIGKSTVAQQFARHPQLARLFGAERYHVALDGVASADGVRSKLADAFELSGSRRLDELDQLLRAGPNRLILLDTVDDPLAEAGANVAALLTTWAAFPGVTLVMTSRPERAPEGDWLVKRRVPPLGPQGVADIFHQFSGGKHRTDGQLAAVLKLADGMPLAAKLLGWFALDCDALAEVLDAWRQQGVGLLHQSDRDRSLSVTGTVGMSLQRPKLQAAPPAVRLLRLLAGLPNGLLVADLPELLPDDAPAALRVVRSVGGLADEADGRLTMLAPIREEIQARLPHKRDDWYRTIRFYAEWVRVHGDAFFTKGEEAVLARFRAEQTNFELLLRAGIDAGLTETVYGTWGLSLFGLRLGIDCVGLLTDAATLGKVNKEERGAAFCYGKIADVLQQRGETDELLRIRREEELPVYERLGDVREKAVTMGKIADVLQDRGETDEALRIRREEELPVFERLGDVRSKAVTLGKIADVLQQRGETDEALRIRREEQLPVYERLGDVYSKAVTMGKIADVLQQRGETDEALRIRREEQLPVYERLGDVYCKAVTMGQIADVLQRRGETDEALRIRREEELPVYERLGDVRGRIICRAKIGRDLIGRGNPEDRPEAREHLEWALAAARRLRLPEAAVIETILHTLEGSDRRGRR